MTDPFDFLPNQWSGFEANLYEDAFSGVMETKDPFAEAMFHEAFFNFDTGYTNEVREAFYAYLEDVYGIEFDDVFDWEAWRDAYEGEG